MRRGPDQADVDPRRLPLSAPKDDSHVALSRREYHAHADEPFRSCLLRRGSADDVLLESPLLRERR